MSPTDPKKTYTLQVLNADRKPLGGTVDVTIRSEATGAVMNLKGVDASKDIPVPVAGTVPPGVYQVSVTAGSLSGAAQFTVGSDAPGPVAVVVQGNATQNPAGAGDTTGRTSQTVQGVLTLDQGLPAANLTVLLYNVGFGGTQQQLAKTTTDASGAYKFSYAAQSAANLQVRVLDASQKEVSISATKFQASRTEILDLVVPAAVQPLASEFDRLSADVNKITGGLPALARAQEDATRQDLTLLHASTSWDARLVALAATAAVTTAQFQLPAEATPMLYALYRAGLPTDPASLCLVPTAVAAAALQLASNAGIVTMNADQLKSATAEYDTFANKTRLTLKAAGAVSTFGESLPPNMSQTEQAAFTKVYFENPSAGAALWTAAANAGVSAQTLTTLQLTGKFLYLTYNNAPLAQNLVQQVGSVDNLPQLAEKDFHDPATWVSTLNGIAGTGGASAVAKLIPATYTAANVTDNLNAYAADLARKVRLSFPTQVTARMVETGKIALPASGPNVATFLKAAAPLGFQLGRTPLNAFLNQSSSPKLDATSTENLKTLQRVYQITPSPEALQATVAAGFTSAYQIASTKHDDFVNKYASIYASGKEASLVHRKAQQVASVTFNFFSMAKHMDTSPPIYGLSASDADRQDAKNAIVQQFPTMTGLFGSLDFCQCDDCRSVLSPAAYFVDLLEFLRKSNVNAAKYSPLDVLVGKDATVTGRRPDLAALPLTCENTNTALPYIDLVNEIFEYYVANNLLDRGVAYDTGSASTADLTAEPQHILPQVYTTVLRNAVYPANLPYDLWIETVRGFLNYFKSPLAQALDTFRPVDQLELFTDASNFVYYRAQILAEALGLAPAEYQVLTCTDPGTLKPSVAQWFLLYGYSTESAALAALPPAKTLAQALGLTYQEITDVVTTGFLNPGLYAILYQFERFSLDMHTAFAYTGQPGYTALAAGDKTAFEAQLDAITAQYKKVNPASTFDARAWLAAALPANYSKQVLILRDPDSGCNFNSTTLEYADGSAATALDFLKLHLFVRLWKKLGWTMDETDRALQSFFPKTLPAWTDPGFAAAFSAAWKTALVYLAHLDDLNTKLAPASGRAALLPFWGNIATQGDAPLYANLFLLPGAAGNDWAFDDPSGAFPWTPSDPLSNHQSIVQGVLGLTQSDIAAIFADAGAAVNTVNVVIGGQNVAVPSFTLANLSLCYRYSLLAKSLSMPIADLIAIKALSGLNPFAPMSGSAISTLADDVVFHQTLAFLKAAAAVTASGFTVEDLQYLLRHQFDPVGKYQVDSNSQMNLLLTVANGLSQIQTQNQIPQDLFGAPETLTDQRLSGLFPSAILKSLLTQLNNGQTYSASQSGVAPGAAIDPTPFASDPAITFSYDPVTQIQTVGHTGLLLNGAKQRLTQLNGTPLFAGLLTSLQTQAASTFAANVNNILGVWASLAAYEATATAPTALPSALTQTDPALSLNYDQAEQLQWLGYRGVLTDAKKLALTTVNGSGEFTSLLDALRAQFIPAYTELIGSLLAMLLNVPSFEAIQTGVAASDQLDPSLFVAYPQLQFSYDAAAQRQSATSKGVLTAASQSALNALLPTSTVLQNLLQQLRNDALAAFQTLAGTLLTVAPADLDTVSAPFLAVDDPGKQKRVKAELVNVFLPLQARKLSQDLIVTTLSAVLSSDPSLTLSALTDAALLSDPSNPGKSLLATFLAVPNQGVSATYYASADQSGAVLASAAAASADMDDPSNPNAGKAGTGSARFEGYLQVPVDGPYRLFAELGNANASVSVAIDPPDPTTLLNNPILPSTYKAAKDHDELSQFVQLRGGALYHFTVDFTNLGASGAGIQIQGEHLPQGPLSQITLYAAQSISAFLRACTLLAKVMQILQGMNLNERELLYFNANSDRFNNLDLSALPTQSSDDSLPKAIALFSQFLTLADYADLRTTIAGGSDGLIDVFANVNQTFVEPLTSPDSNNNAQTPWRRLANLSRRDAQTIRDVALHFGLMTQVAAGSNNQVTAVSDFGNNTGIRRIWQALQLIQIVGIPTASFVDAMGIVSASPAAPGQIAGNLKNAVKAQYTPDVWRPVAQSVFDPLRQRKRDALVSYLLNHLGLDSSNQLFEYFLVDPGMEPVVQTSRLRLALSSVQTFIQRCLLNLENGNTDHPERNISPSVIDADLWEWMKRYRVWEANREIFLFPENWMEPELRLDKTDLFETLEGALLQGDITSDLVDAAFQDYLTGLEVRARLDIVSTYLDQDPNQLEVSTLYVLGRTYGTAHKYFLRTYASGTWSAWEAVTPDLEGDHIVMVNWRGRLNLFWLSFVTKAQTPSAPAPAQPGDPSAASLPLGTLMGGVFSSKAVPQIQVQLHWSQYFSGKWSDRVSTDVAKYPLINVFDGFDPTSDIFIHASKELDASGNEGAALVSLNLNLGGGNDYRSFRITSKNSDPGFDMYTGAGSDSPYNAWGVQATVTTGSGTLDASFETNIEVGGNSTSTWNTEHILHSTRNFSLVRCANEVAPPFLDPSEPDYMEAGSLVSPFFFKDTSTPNSNLKNLYSDELTFFVQPSLTEVTMEQWNGYTVLPSQPAKNWTDPRILGQLVLKAQVPVLENPNPPDPEYSIYTMPPSEDWLTDPATVLSFGAAQIGQSGQTKLGISAAELAPASNFTLVSKEGARVSAAQSLQPAVLAGAVQEGN